jgi:lipopolysaccharide export system permease protein
MILPRYVSRRFTMTFLKVTMIISALIFLVEFVEHLRRYSDRASGLPEIITLTALQIPEALGGVLSIVFLLTSLTLFVSLARSSEMVIVRASGMSVIRLVMIPFGLAILFGIAYIALFHPIVSASKQKYESLKTELTTQAPTPLSISEGGIWLRQVSQSNTSVINAQRASADGSTLFAPVFHLFNANGQIKSRISSQSATLNGNLWYIENARVWNANENQRDIPQDIQSVEAIQIETNLTREQILDGFAPPDTISLWALPGFINQLENSGFAATRHRQYFQTTLATPLMFAAMVFIGAAVTSRHTRFGSVGIMILITVLCGFALYIFRNLASSLGSAGEIPVEVAAWSPPIAAILLVFALLLHLEDG